MYVTQNTVLPNYRKLHYARNYRNIRVKTKPWGERNREKNGFFSVIKISKCSKALLFKLYVLVFLTQMAIVCRAASPF